MSDFDPQPADTSGRDFQESLLGREELAAPPSGTFGGFMGTTDEAGPRFIDPMGAGGRVGHTAVGETIKQQLVYGSALLTHMFGSVQATQFDSTAPGHYRLGWESRLLEQADKLNPEPGTQGVGTQALAGLAGFATQIAEGGGAGGIASVPVLSAYEGYHNARAQGLDDATAEKMGLAEGASGGLFVALPFGSIARNSSMAVRLLAEVAAGVGANTTIGGTSRYAEHKILADAGYPELAEQYKGLDANSILMDAATGLFPAAHAAVSAGAGVAGSALRKAALLAAADRIARENGRARDAVSTATDGRALRERAVGIPIDQESAQAHNVADRTALMQTLNKEGIDLSGTPIDEEGASFLQPPQDAEAMNDARSIFMQTLNESLGEDNMLDPAARRVAEALGIPMPEAREPVKAEPEQGPISRELPDTEEYERMTGVPLTAEERLKSHAAREALTAMREETGNFQVGGKIIRKTEDVNSPDYKTVVGRTPWVPRAEWWPDRPKGLTEAQVKTAVDKALKGEALGKRERAMVDYMLGVAEERGRAKETAGMTASEEQMWRDRAEFDRRVPEMYDLEPAEKDLAALETKARVLDNDRVTQIMESWEKDDPETIKRVGDELQKVIDRGQEGERGGSGERPAGSGGPELGEGAERQGAAPTESVRTASERNRPAADSGTGAGFSDTGSDAGSKFDGRDAALARQVIADRPDATIVDENGKAVPAADAMADAKALEDQANAEAAKAFNAAADCVRRS